MKEVEKKKEKGVERKGGERETIFEKVAEHFEGRKKLTCDCVQMKI